MNNHQHYIDLICSLAELAQQQSNPVLQIMPGTAEIKEMDKYPESPLEFGAGHWCAYYHSHKEGTQKSAHGHFHVFTRTDASQNDWGHVVGVAMDYCGQPCELFTVNQWVTSGPLLNWTTISKNMTLFDRAHEQQLVVEWLRSFLLLYEDELEMLILQRDQALQEKGFTADNQTVLEDRKVYLLSHTSLDLQKKLQGILVNNII